MKFDEWVVDLAAGTATHENGFSLRIEGKPKDPSEVYPGRFPDSLSFVEQARLLRAGIELIAKASAEAPKSWQTSGAQDAKSQAIREREELAKQFAERSDKPERSVLSLKK